LKYHRVRGGDFYEAARAEVERQLQLMKENDSEAESRTAEAKTAEEVSLKHSSSPNRIPDVLPSLACLGDLSHYDQGLFLLTRLSKVFPQNMTFSKVDLFWCEVDRPDPYGLAAGIPRHEQRRAVQHLLTYPWREMVQAGYVPKALADSELIKITDEGWAVVERNRVKVDIHWTANDDFFSRNDPIPESVRPKPGMKGVRGFRAPSSRTRRKQMRDFRRALGLEI